MLAFAVLILWMAFLVGLHLRQKAEEARRQQAQQELIQIRRTLDLVPVEVHTVTNSHFGREGTK